MVKSSRNFSAARSYSASEEKKVGDSGEDVAAVENKDLMLNHPSQNVINRYSSELWTIDNTTDARKSPVIGKIVIQGRSPSSRPQT